MLKLFSSHHTKSPSPREILIQSLLIFALGKLMLIFEWSQVVNTGLGFIDSVMRGDSWWFKNIVEHGYMHEVLTADPIRPLQANWAFFPLFPILTKLLSLVGLPSSIAAIIVNQTQLLLSLYLAYWLALKSLPPRAAVFVPLMIAMSPANIWFMAAYSDMTYLFLSIVAFYCLKSERLWWFALSGALLALSRFAGVFILAALIIHYLQRYKCQRNQKLSNAPPVPDSQHIIIILLTQSIIVFSGLGAFMFTLYLIMGDPLAFYHIQSAWGHLGTNWWGNPWQTLLEIWNTGVAHDRLFLLLAPLWLSILIWEGYYAEAAFSFFCLLIPVAAGSLWSYSRYALGLYPFYLTIALIAKRSPPLALAILLLSVFISASYWTTWLNDGWV